MVIPHDNFAQVDIRNNFHSHYKRRKVSQFWNLERESTRIRMRIHKNKRSLGQREELRCRQEQFQTQSLVAVAHPAWHLVEQL